MPRLLSGLTVLAALVSAAAGRHLGGPDHLPQEPALSDQLRHPEELNWPTTTDGLMLFEADILLPGGAANRTNVLMPRRWPLGQPVPYLITPRAEVRRHSIEAAIAHWEENTCVTFVERPADFSGEPHLRFINGRGCRSFLGRLNRPSGQPISIGRGCGGLASTAHQIAHALGFLHEQTRLDRDEHVEVMWDNIRKRARRFFSIKPRADPLGVEYDLQSIMHFEPHKFAIDRSKPTLRAREPLEQHLVGRKVGRMTHRDIAGANLAYRCADHCASPPACLNGGFVDKTCRCVCPEGISGERCETKPADYRYYGALCGDVNITTAGVVSADFSLERSRKDCYWLVTAPDGQEVSLAFGDVSMNQYPHCRADRLSVAVQGDLRDAVASGCGVSLSDTQYQSTGGRLLLYFRIRGGSRRARRFNAVVAFVPAA